MKIITKPHPYVLPPRDIQLGGTHCLGALLCQDSGLSLCLSKSKQLLPEFDTFVKQTFEASEHTSKTGHVKQKGLFTSALYNYT